MKIKTLYPITMAFVLSSCGDDSSDDAATASGTTRTATGAVEATDVSQLGLTGALSVDLPDALENSTSSGLRLAVGQKSMEACLMRASAQQVLQQVTMAGTTLSVISKLKDQQFTEHSCHSRLFVDGASCGTETANRSTRP